MKPLLSEYAIPQFGLESNAQQENLGSNFGAGFGGGFATGIAVSAIIVVVSYLGLTRRLAQTTYHSDKTEASVALAVSPTAERDAVAVDQFLPKLSQKNGSNSRRSGYDTCGGIVVDPKDNRLSM